MITQQDIQVNDYLTWEYCHDPDIQYLDCPPPAPVKNFFPEWFKELKGNLKSYLPEGFGGNHTVRHCLGLRGLLDIGYTIPLPETLNGADTYFSRGFLHPEMLHGTKWARQPGGPWPDPTCTPPWDTSPYEYRLKLLSWPWRAKMSAGWRLLILPYLLDWSDDYFEFAGAVEPNYYVNQGTNIGESMKWTQHIDTTYNYYNLETVVAFKRTCTVEKGKLIFCAVPVYDPLANTN